MVVLLSLFTCALIYALYAVGRSKLALYRFASKKIFAEKVNVLATSHDHERIELGHFFHPYFRPTESVRFEHCDLLGPASIAFLGGSMDQCGMYGCEIVIVRPDRPIRSAVVFKNCMIVRCNLFGVTLLMSIEHYNQSALRGMQVPVISDGRIGDI